MATIINNPAGQGNNEGIGAGLIVGIILVIIVAILLFMYGLPMLQNTTTEKQPNTQKIEIQLPATPAPKTTTDNP